MQRYRRHLLFYVFAIVYFPAQAMENSPHFYLFQCLPNELCLHVLTYTAKGESLKQTVKNLINLARVSQRFSCFARDSGMADDLVKLPYLESQMGKENYSYKRLDDSLFLAATAGLVAIFKVLLKVREIQDFYFRERALLGASFGGHKEIVEILLDRTNVLCESIDVNYVFGDGCRILLYASIMDRLDIVILLLDRGADTASRVYDNENFLTWAIKNEKNRIVATILYKQIEDALLVARTNGKQSIVADIVDQYGERALADAAALGRNEAIMIFLSENVDINSVSSGYTALMQAAYGGHYETVKIFIDNGADINAKDNEGNEALDFAVLACQNEICRLLIENGADVNARNKSGATALHDAATLGQKEICRLLVAHGAEVNAKDSDGNTALAYAAAFNFATAELLLECGADVNAGGKLGGPLLRAIDKDIITMLLDAGAQINGHDSIIGNTALIEAVVRDDKERVRLLLERGADVNVGNDVGQTPLSIAQKKGFTEILSLLEKHVNKH